MIGPPGGEPHVRRAVAVCPVLALRLERATAPRAALRDERDVRRRDER